MDPENDPFLDPGMNSHADLKMFTRILLFGLVGAVIVALVATLATGNWTYAILLVAAYVVIAALQWFAAYRRAQKGGFTGEF